MMQRDSFWEHKAAELVDAVVEALPDRDPRDVLEDAAAPDILRARVPDHYDGSRGAASVRATAVQLLRKADQEWGADERTT